MEPFCRRSFFGLLVAACVVPKPKALSGMGVAAKLSVTISASAVYTFTNRGVFHRLLEAQGASSAPLVLKIPNGD